MLRSPSSENVSASLMVPTQPEQKTQPGQEPDGQFWQTKTGVIVFLPFGKGLETFEDCLAFGKALLEKQSFKGLSYQDLIKFCNGEARFIFESGWKKFPNTQETHESNINEFAAYLSKVQENPFVLVAGNNCLRTRLSKNGAVIYLPHNPNTPEDFYQLGRLLFESDNIALTYYGLHYKDIANFMTFVGEQWVAFDFDYNVCRLAADLMRHALENFSYPAEKKDLQILIQKTYAEMQLHIANYENVIKVGIVKALNLDEKKLQDEKIRPILQKRIHLQMKINGLKEELQKVRQEAKAFDEQEGYSFDEKQLAAREQRIAREEYDFEILDKQLSRELLLVWKNLKQNETPKSIHLGSQPAEIIQQIITVLRAANYQDLANKIAHFYNDKQKAGFDKFKENLAKDKQALREQKQKGVAVDRSRESAIQYLVKELESAQAKCDELDEVLCPEKAVKKAASAPGPTLPLSGKSVQVGSGNTNTVLAALRKVFQRNKTKTPVTPVAQRSQNLATAVTPKPQTLTTVTPKPQTQPTPKAKPVVTEEGSDFDNSSVLFRNVISPTQPLPVEDTEQTYYCRETRKRDAGFQMGLDSAF